MSDGTGTDPSTDRCPDCGHLWERPCGCSCCGLSPEDEDEAAQRWYEQHYQPADSDPDSRWA